MIIIGVLDTIAVRRLPIIAVAEAEGGTPDLAVIHHVVINFGGRQNAFGCLDARLLKYT